MSEYRAVYISPISEGTAGCTCKIEEVYGKDAGKIHKQNYLYDKETFKGYFHGTLLMFCKNNQQITDKDEILSNFPVKFAYVTAINLQTMEFYASDGVLYNYKDNYYCKHNKQTFENMKRDLEKCNSFYALLVIDKNNGHIIDITLVCDPDKNSGFAYQYRVERGFVPTHLENMKKIGQKVVSSERRGDEKLTQDDVDRLIEQYTKDYGLVKEG